MTLNTTSFSGFQKLRPGADERQRAVEEGILGKKGRAGRQLLPLQDDAELHHLQISVAKDSLMRITCIVVY